ncbi:MAG TPA: phosphoribosylanthranilate isomerase [Gemmatimonadaceae bacterium]|nr:phosphoribosylanthranilate isomerase [Gemmatimonadaceae bacterium]
MPAVKFCGLRRAEDAAEAVRLGASYVGVIFAGGPRLVTIDQARTVLAATRDSDHVRRVGVFGADTPAAIARVVAEVGLDVVQLSADPDAKTVDAVRAATGVEVWAAVRCTTEFPPGAITLFEHADAILLDAKVDGKLGGTGQTLAWENFARARSAACTSGRRLVLAGGLTPANVAQAIAALQPDVVDVSSGVETAPGIKDHERMRAFLEATHS